MTSFLSFDSDSDSEAEANEAKIDCEADGTQETPALPTIVSGNQYMSVLSLFPACSLLFIYFSVNTIKPSRSFTKICKSYKSKLLLLNCGICFSSARRIS